MTEKTKAEKYLAYVDQILSDDKNIGSIDDIEIAKLLRLTRLMISIDFSLSSKIRDSLQQQLLMHIYDKSKSSLKNKEIKEKELTEEELMLAAAGLQGEVIDSICPKCSGRYSRLLQRCPFCCI